MVTILVTLLMAHVTLTSQAISSELKTIVDGEIAKRPSAMIKPDEIGVTWSALAGPTRTPVTGSYRGDQDMYPASVVKLFFLGYEANLLEKGELKMTPELERATTDMIVDSVNDATGLVLDTITGTTGGPELDPTALADWMKKRQAVNQWYQSIGFPKLNASQKTWNEGPYGRERQGYGPKFELRNSLSPDVCVKLMTLIATDRIVSPAKCEWMRHYLSREIPAENPATNEQAKDFSGQVLPKGSKLWSKAGWTDTVRHDVAFVRLPDGREYVYAIFTKNHSDAVDLIPAIARQMFEWLATQK